MAVRAGDLAPSDALEFILDRAAPLIREHLPPEVELQDVLAYIRETLEDDPAFMSLVDGGVP
jgi:hypothetical protein